MTKSITLFEMYQLLVLLASVALLMWLVIRGHSIFVVAPLCALVAVTLSGVDPLATMTGPYMEGFSKYVRDFYLIFALGAVFGKMMEDSGAANTVANTVGHWLGEHRACLAVVLACALMTYGGVSLFVVGFSVYPLAVQLFRAANLPRRFIPASIAFGSITFTMTSAGSPEIQNLIPITYLIDNVTKRPLTDARAGWPASIIVSTLMFVVGQWYMEWSIRRAAARGEKFEAHVRDKVDIESVEAPTKPLPSFSAAILPLVITLLALNALPYLCHELGVRVTASDETAGILAEAKRVLTNMPESPTLAIFLGTLAGLITLRSFLPNAWTSYGDGFVNGLMAVGSTSAVVGFGAAVKTLPAFNSIVDWVTHLPLDPLVCAALAVAIIAAIAGSASGGQGIALPIIKPIFVDEMGVAPRALHRVVAISSGTLDSLPANGYLVMLIRNICGETHARAYGPIFVTTVLIPAGGTALAILLFKIFPSWANM